MLQRKSSFLSILKNIPRTRGRDERTRENKSFSADRSHRKMGSSFCCIPRGEKWYKCSDKSRSLRAGGPCVTTFPKALQVEPGRVEILWTDFSELASQFPKAQSLWEQQSSYHVTKKSSGDLNKSVMGKKVRMCIP